MYDPLVRAFNYALDRLSRADVPGLPKFQEKHRIVFAWTEARCISSESYLQGLCKPDITLLNWNNLMVAHELPVNTPYWVSHKLDACCKSGKEQPTLKWRDVLSTVEVKRSGVAKGKVKGIDSKVYTGNFSDFQGDFKVPPSSEPWQPAPLGIVGEEQLARKCTFAVFRCPHIFIRFSFHTLRQ